MEAAILDGLNGLILGLTTLGWGQALMILIGCLLLYLGISKGFEPLLRGGGQDTGNAPFRRLTCEFDELL